MATATASVNGKAASPILIPGIRRAVCELIVVGDTPLITHPWSLKAKQMLLDAQTGKPRQKKEPKDPQQDYEDSIYRTEDGQPGVPAIAFKNAAVTACTQIEGVTKVLARGAFHVMGDILPIEGAEPQIDEQMVRVGMGVADIRYRARFDPPWRVRLRVMYNASVMNEAQIAHLVNTAGFAVGVCEHRPEKDGSNGMFHVAEGPEG